LAQSSKTFLSKIEHAGHALLRIIKDILDFSKIEAGTWTWSLPRSRCNNCSPRRTAWSN
jgi:signal transduction histidine kinase